MSTVRPNTSDSGGGSRPALAENPWLWVMLFGGMGVLAIVVVGPKYAARTARVERMQAQRERIAQERAAGRDPAAAVLSNTGRNVATATGTQVAPPRDPYVESDFVPPTKLYWLLGLMALVLVVGVVGFLTSRRTGRAGRLGEAAHTSAGEQAG